MAVSWYPPDMRDDNGESVDEFMPLLLEVAHKYHIKVCMSRFIVFGFVCFAVMC